MRFAATFDGHRIIDLPAAAGAALRRLPHVHRLLLENVLRCAHDPAAGRAAILAWLGTGRSTAEIPARSAEPASSSLSRGVYLDPRAYCLLATQTASANSLAFSTTSPRSRLLIDDGARAPPATTAKEPAANRL